MRKIIIISYFFPPCGLTASQRIAGWANYLHQFGLYPIIITRNWDHKVSSPADILKPGGEVVKHEKNEKFEVYYLPHKGSLRDKLFYKWSGTKLSFITKPFTLLELFGQNFFNFFTPFTYLKKKAMDLLKEDKEIELVLISGNPFILFKFGFQLKKKFPRINWVADYRDDWSTSEIGVKKGFLNGLIRTIEKRSESKWLSNVSFISSVSPYYTQKIASFINKRGLVLYNGFDELREVPAVPHQEFTLVYNGTLYATQDIETLMHGYKRLIDAYKNISFKFKFPGLAFDEAQAERVKKVMQGYESNIEITERIPQADVIAMQLKADVLVMLTHIGVKGVTSSKLFEYFSLQRPILLYPQDGDILDSLIESTGAGFVAPTEEKLYACLVQWVEQFKKEGSTQCPLNKMELMQYSRSNQAGVLARAILANTTE